MTSNSLFAHAEENLFFVGAAPFAPTSITVSPTHVVAVTEDGERRDYVLTDIVQASVSVTADFRRPLVRRWSKVTLAVTGFLGGPVSVYDYRGRFLSYIVGRGPSDVGESLGPLAPTRPPRWWCKALASTVEQYGRARCLGLLAVQSHEVVADIESCRSSFGSVASRRARKAALARIRAARQVRS
ncbi:hypothetical protein [Cellulomonas sp.]|uniref:hypothetical protein n=1 Tax=Cellulomonas sp. TaxID=40001 RepID=UPI003BAC4240